jgi:hypothetical protein
MCIAAASESGVPHHPPHPHPRKSDAHLVKIVSETREYPERNFDLDALRGNRAPGAFVREFANAAG